MAGRVSLGFALWGALACAHRPAPNAPEQPATPEVRWSTPVSFPTLEHISADVSVLGVHAGVFDLEVARACHARVPSVELRSTMSTAGLVRFFKATDGSSRTTMDPGTARPTESDLLIVDGPVMRRYRAHHGPGVAETTYQRTGKAPKHETERIATGEHPLDMASAFELLRYWRAPAQSRGYFYVLLGKDLWRVSVRAKGERTIEYQGAQRQAILIEGVARRQRIEEGQSNRSRRFSIWLTNDASSTPLRVKGDASFGTVLMELTAHRTEELGSVTCATAAR